MNSLGGPPNFSKKTVNVTVRLEFISTNVSLDTIIHSISELLTATPLAVLYFYAPNIYFSPKKYSICQICTVFGSTYLHEQLFSLVHFEICSARTHLSLIMVVTSQIINLT